MQARASKVVFKVGLNLRCYCYCGLLSFIFVGLFWCGASSQLFLMGFSWVVQGLDTHHLNSTVFFWSALNRTTPCSGGGRLNQDRHGTSACLGTSVAFLWLGVRAVLQQ